MPLPIVVAGIVAVIGGGGGLLWWKKRPKDGADVQALSQPKPINVVAKLLDNAAPPTKIGWFGKASEPKAIELVYDPGWRYRFVTLPLAWVGALAIAIAIVRVAWRYVVPIYQSL